MSGPLKRRWNLPLWAGFAIAVAAFGTYTTFFALFPLTRDVPWATYLLFAVSGLLLAVGIRRAYRDSEHYRGKIAGPILGSLSLLMCAFFLFIVLYLGKQVPAAAAALQPGQPAPAFTLSNTDGVPVTSSDLLKDHRALVLVFYRGYW